MENLNDFKISTEDLPLLFDANFVKKATENGQGVVQAAFGVSDKTLERYYQAAAKLLEQHRWQDARDAFTFLTFLNAFVYNFWLGLGVSEQSMESYDRALIAYAMAELLDPQNPVPNANGFQCAIGLKNKELAEEFWKKAVEKCQDKEEWSALKDKLEQMHKVFKSK
jgi:type III secretion system low calcium response chaperone LcrH/SycD